MKATMISKAPSAKSWLETIATNETHAVEVVIEKTIILTEQEFKKFACDLLNEYDFIKDNASLMRIDENGVWYCIEVTADGSFYGILVESEGFGYARYSAIHVKGC